MQIMLMILSCVRGRETFEEGASAPSPQTLRDRLCLEGNWLVYFHATAWKLASRLVKRFRNWNWYISVDETHSPFFGNRRKLNQELVAKGFGKLVYGYKAKTPGATGSFCFLVISLCCCKIRIPIGIRMVSVGESQREWIKELINHLLSLVPQATVLADRGFAKTWFFRFLDDKDVKYIVRLPVKAKQVKKKIEQGLSCFQYWMTDSDTNEKALLNVRVVSDAQDRQYIFATNLSNKRPKQLIQKYLERWDLENIFKDSDRVTLLTSSRNHKMRLFCIVLSFLLFLLWQANQLNLTDCHKPSLRQFIKYWIKQLCELLNCVINPIGQLILHPP